MEYHKSPHQLAHRLLLVDITLLPDADYGESLSLALHGTGLIVVCGSRRLMESLVTTLRLVESVPYLGEALAVAVRLAELLKVRLLQMMYSFCAFAYLPLGSQRRSR